jgi:hypothetical protein
MITPIPPRRKSPLTQLTTSPSTCVAIIAIANLHPQRRCRNHPTLGREINLAQQKPYTGTHNSGYTECQEFFGAITLDSQEPLGNQIVTMLDVALRGIGDRWNDVVIPGFDFCVVENTLGKYGTRVETLTKVPINVQELVLP